jgi:ATP-dependent RNA helicase DDX24/MAK5
LIRTFLEDTDIPEISVELTLLDKLKDRVTLARQIDSQQHKIKKQHHEMNWLKETADAMEIELDPDILG